MTIPRLCSFVLLSLACAFAVCADDAVPETNEGGQTRETPTVVDVTPTGVDLVFGVNRCEEAISRSYELNEAIGSGYTPGNFRNECAQIFGDGVVDFDGPMSIFAMTPFNPQNFNLERLGAMITVQDPATARRIMEAPDGLLDGETFAGRFNSPEFTLPMAFREHRLYFAWPGEVMGEILEQPSLASELDADVVQRLDAADFVAIGRRGPMLENFWEEALPAMSEDDSIDEEQRRVAEQFQQLVQSVAWLTFTGNVIYNSEVSEAPIGTGFGLSLLCDHAADSDTAKLLTRLAGENQSTTLEGLPPGDVVVAFASTLEGAEQHAFAKHIADIAANSWNTSNGLPKSLLVEQFLAIFEEAGNHTQGARVAVYRNSDYEADGRFGVVLIFDAEDPGAFLSEMQQLLRLANADELAAAGDAEPVTDEEIRQLVQQLGDRVYRVRRDASNRLMLVGPRVVPFVREGLQADSLELRTRAQVILERLETLSSIESRHFFGSDLFEKLDLDLSYVIGGDQLGDDRPIDVISATITDDAEQPYAIQLASWLGPDWNRMRIVQTDRHVVVLVGSRTELLEQTVSNLEGSGGESLQLTRPGDVDRRSQFELHVDLSAFSTTETSQDGTAEEATENVDATTPVELTGFAFSITPDSMYVDAFAPLSQIQRNRWWFFW